MIEPRRLNSLALVALLLICATSLAGLLMLPSIWLTAEEEVVIYTSLDYDFSAPIFADFTRRTGIHVRAKYDTEATKTVGLTQALFAESERPRCDLFWNNEILNTLRLQRAGLLRAYDSPAGAAYPASYRDPNGHWYGFAARARILLVNTDLVPVEEYPTGLDDLTEPMWRERFAMAKPLFGTTATHAACLFAKLGEPRARELFLALKRNGVHVLAGNRQVASAVAAGQIAIGLTDTDDAMVEIAAGRPVAIIYPDQEHDQPGTLFIPNTLGLIAGSPSSENANRLVEYLLSEETETRLALGASAQIPLNPAVKVATQVARPHRDGLATEDSSQQDHPETIRAMQVDFARAAEFWDSAATFLREHFTVD